ncbi:DNA polymerase IV [Bacillus sp. JCM 19046]|nr:DNA polymerase IV [Bacillus sp. JCM 19046]
MEQLDLIHHFGKMGLSLYRKARGIDNKPLTIDRERNRLAKSTRMNVLRSEDDVQVQLKRLAGEVGAALERVEKQGKTIVLKIRYRSFDTLTRRISLPTYVQKSDELFTAATELWNEYGQIEREVRLLGISVTNLEPIQYQPISLFSYK